MDFFFIFVVFIPFAAAVCLIASGFEINSDVQRYQHKSVEKNVQFLLALDEVTNKKKEINLEGNVATHYIALSIDKMRRPENKSHHA